MKLLFLQNYWIEHLGTMSLAAKLKSLGHRVKVRIGRRFRDFSEPLETFKPQLVCFSITTGGHLWALRIAKEIRQKSGIPVIFGGPHCTYSPDIIKNSQVDFICIGEGEEPFAEFCEKFEEIKKGKEIPNILTKNSDSKKPVVRPLIKELDSLPFPDRALYYENYSYLKNFPTKRFMTSRGCPYSCNFCHNHILKRLYRGKGNFLRLHSPDYSIEEILEVKRNYPLKTVIFEDDLFTLNEEWLFSFLEKYRKKIRLPFACNIFAATINEKTLKEMKKSGCFRVTMGVESGNFLLRKLLLNKDVSDDKLKNAANLVHREKIRLTTTNMFALPGETLIDALKTLELNINLKTDLAWSSFLQPYPNTKIAKLIKKSYNSIHEKNLRFRTTFFDRTPLKHPEIREISKVQKLFYLTVKFPFLYPLVKRIVKLPFFGFYNIIFYLTFIERYRISHKLNKKEMVLFLLRNFLLYFKT